MMIFAFMLAPGKFAKNQRAGREISEQVGVPASAGPW
jgi:hypothetical protein